MNLLDEILHWFFWETIWTVVTYAFPIVALGLSIYCFMEGNYLWGCLWLAAAVGLGALFYRRPHRQDY
jgi:hypothetical protein